uniref:Vitellogenin2 n=1 Tax=Uroteuthis edulis TaxID=55720 RepID=A0A1L7MRU0_9MOLL|nr:vitellogenin2 [Uroteuthis edulis]
MLSYITFILAFALVASDSRAIHGNWRYEGQFVIGNPQLNWDQAGWKLLVPDTILARTVGELGKEPIMVKFQNPQIRTLNDRLPERSDWTQVNKMNWLQTIIENIKRPFIVRFENSTVKELVTERGDIKESLNIKMTFAKHLASALQKIVREPQTHNMKTCDSEVKTLRTINQTVITSITYHACEHFHGRTIGVIPKAQLCEDCQNPKLKLPLGSYTKVEVVRTNTTVVSILAQNVVALPVYQPDSPTYSIYGNTSLIRVSGRIPKDLPVEKIESRMLRPEHRVIVRPNGLVRPDLLIRKPDIGKQEPNELIKKALKLIRSLTINVRQGENVLALYDLLCAEGNLIIKDIPRYLQNEEERNTFFTVLATQESHLALEVLMNATMNKLIDVSKVPLFMILSSKVTNMIDHSVLHKFIEEMEKVSPISGLVSNLAMSIIMRRNMKNTTEAIGMLAKDLRLKLAMAGNAGINIQVPISESDVLNKLAYVQSKRSLDKIHHKQVLAELIEIFISNKQATIVRAEAFKVIMTLTCDRSIWSTVFAKMNDIDDPSLISYVVSYLKSYVSNKLPTNIFLVQQAQVQLPLLKAKLQESLYAKHLTLSAFNRKANMGVAVMGEYVIPKISKHNYMKASVEVQAYVLNTLISLAKVQIAVPMNRLRSVVEESVSLKIQQLKDIKVLRRLAKKVLRAVSDSELSIFNDDMEILYISARPLVEAVLNIKTTVRSFATSIKKVAVPVVIKKHIITPMGPYVELSLVSYLAIDAVAELDTKKKELTVSPRLIGGTRIKIQSDDKITVNTGVLFKGQYEQKNITLKIEKEPLGVRALCILPLRIVPVATLQVIPTTGSLLGTPSKDWEQQTSASPRVKSIPIQLTAGLSDPAIMLNISGLINKPLNKNILYALQEPQLVQVYLLPSYDLPTNEIVIELVQSTRRCLPTKNCIVPVDLKLRRITWCQSVCINAFTEKPQPLQGSFLRTLLKPMNDSENIEIMSRIKVLNESKVGIFDAYAKLILPPVIVPQQLLNATYLNELRQHEFNRVTTMQMTTNETVTTSQLKMILNGVTLPESRQEDYTDMNKVIVDLYPTLYIHDTLKIPTLHSIFQRLLNLSTRSIAARSQLYDPDWKPLAIIHKDLRHILQTPLQKDQPEIVEMQDNVILWCLMKYFEVGHDYLKACRNCSAGLEFVRKFKAELFNDWFNFHNSSKPVVIEVLKKSANGQLDSLVDRVMANEKLLIQLIKAKTAAALTTLYGQLENGLILQTALMHQLTFKQQMLSKTIMAKIVSAESLKTMADHWHAETEHYQDERIRKMVATTDLGVSFMSVSGRFIIQFCNLLYTNSNNYVAYHLDSLASQAISLIDYKRWSRSVIVDVTKKPILQRVTTKLINVTLTTIKSLKSLSPAVTADPVLRIFITEIMELLRITAGELERVPQYAFVSSERPPIEKIEWDIIELIKNLTANYRPLSTLKRGIMKENEEQYELRSASGLEKTRQKVELLAAIQWPDFKLTASIVARKSDSQVLYELQQSTLTKSNSMIRTLTSLLFNQTVVDPLWLELNIYRDIRGSVSTVGTLPEWIRTDLAIASERVKVALLPFEVTLTPEDIKAVDQECRGDKCVRAVISRDSRKIDVLSKEPTETILFLQLPTGL